MKTESNRRDRRIRTMPAIGFALTMLFVSVQSANAQWNPSPSPSPNTNIYYNAGNVGVGTTSPGSTLDVQAAEASANLQSTTGANRVYQTFRNTTGLTFIGNESSAGASVFNSGLAYASVFGSNGNTATQFATNNTVRMTIDTGGNVGIGTTSPGSWGAVAVRTYASVGGHNVSASFSDAINSTFSIGHASGNTQLISDTGLSLWTGSTPAQRVFIDNYGRFGINATPTYQFEVVGPSGGTAIRASDNVNSSLYVSFPSTAYTGGSTRAVKIISDSHLFLGAGSADVIAIQANGYVGIGTTNPSDKLHISGSGDTALLVTRTGSSTTSYFQSVGNTTRIGNLSSGGGDITFSPSDSQTVVFKSGGNVGIGTTSPPSEKLEVNGNINVTGTGNIYLLGTIHAKYQDLAEWVPSSEQLAAGTVVVLDSTKSNQVTSSTVSYDTRVAGVVSEQPGIALGEKSENKVLVATTGRVKVKVNASKGAIHIGDLLVTSDIPGVAMKSEPVEFAGRKMHMPGTLIGKALEPLEKGSGKILVLLSLQ